MNSAVTPHLEFLKYFSRVIHVAKQEGRTFLGRGTGINLQSQEKVLEFQTSVYVSATEESETEV